MKITTQQELEKLIATADKSDTIVLNEHLEITFDCKIPCNIKAYNIKAYNIQAYNIDAHNIDAHNIKAWNINANNIKAHNITAYDINAHNITAYDIKAYDIYADNITACNITAHNIKARNITTDNITARNITARNIEYYAFCIAYESLKCKLISGRRENSFHKCLDQEIEIIKEEKKVTIELTQSQLDKIKHLI